MRPLATSDSRTTDARVLAIEPDPQAADALASLFDAHDQLSIEVVPTISRAIDAIERRLPDLIMTTALMGPGEEADLIGRLKQMPQARHVPVVDIPVGISDSGLGRRHTSGLLGTFRRRGAAAPRHGCDAAALQAQILEYVREARAEHARPDMRQPSPELLVPESMALVPAADAALDTASGRERRRARRRRRDEMPWLWTVKLPWGSDVRVVDMSSTGMLIETPAHLGEGNQVELKMIGEQENLVIPAQAVRTEASWVEQGAIYRVGLEFAREIETFGPYPLSMAAALRPRTLTDLLGRVMAEVERGVDPSRVRAKFAEELLHLLPARHVHLRPEAAKFEADDTVHFSVPGAPGAGMILEVAFERGYKPSIREYRFLQAAASAAGVVVAFDPAMLNAEARG